MITITSIETELKLGYVPDDTQILKYLQYFGKNEKLVDIFQKYGIVFTKHHIIQTVINRQVIPFIHTYKIDMNSPDLIYYYKLYDFAPPTYNIDMDLYNECNITLFKKIYMYIKLLLKK